MDLLEIAKQNTPQKPNSKENIFLKFLSLLSVVRGYNILLIVIAQYLSAIFVFSPQKSLRTVLLNLNLYLIVLSTICVIASGYIINNFYDTEKDGVNKPEKSKLDNIVSQKTKLNIYFFLNFIAVLLAILVSFKAFIFFSAYIFSIWFYSHKLKKYPLTSLFTVVILSLLPFFAIFVYYKNFSTIIFTLASFLFFILLIRELIKDLENIKGDVAANYLTIPIKYGERFTKALITLLVVMSFDPIYFLWKYPEIGDMKYYFYLAMALSLPFILLVWKATSKKNYILLHNLVKLLIVLGVFSLSLIDTSIIINRILNHL